MGIFQDILDSMKTVGPPPRAALDRVSAQTLKRLRDQNDPPLDAAHSAANCHFRIPLQTGAGDSDQWRMHLTFFGSLAGYSATTGWVDADFSGDDTVVQGVIDSALNGYIPGYFNGDLLVTADIAGGIQDTKFDLIASSGGSSVLDNIPIIITVEAQGWTLSPEPFYVTPGQGDRPSMQVLRAINAIGGDLQPSGLPASYTRPASNGRARKRQLILDMAAQAAGEDGRPETYAEILALYPRT